MKKFFAFLLLLCTAAAISAACGETAGNGRETVTGTETDADTEMTDGTVWADKEYRIVYSYKKADAVDSVAAAMIQARINSAYGVKFDITDDKDGAQEREILIGHTSREESETIYAGLDGDKFGGYAVTDTKILIFGSTDMILEAAADYFAFNVLGFDNSTKKKVGKPADKLENGTYYIDGTTEKEVLYNGIELDSTWPPRTVDFESRSEIKAPYLTPASKGGTHPGTVDIDVGRQLFVDSFLISKTDLNTVYHSAKVSEEPVIVSDDDYLIFKGGNVIYDESIGKLVIWYGGMTAIYRSESEDGIHWSEPETVFNNKLKAPWSTVWVNPSPSADGSDRYILFIRNADSKFEWKEHYETTRFHGEIYKSSDGKNWEFATETGALGDASLISYNYFRNKWLILGRDNCSFTSGSRVVRYFECSNIVSEAAYRLWESVEWQRTDKNDIPDPELKQLPQFYSVSTNSYESIQLGVFQYWLGPNNNVSKETGIPKITELQLGYSRDGFYYTRPERSTPFISCSREEGAWDRGYLHAASSLCVATNDELWFYYCGFRGGETKQDISAEYANPSIGIGKLRRDGFASLDGTGSVTTEKMTFNEAKKYLFVNAKADSLKAEILDENGNVIDGFSASDCAAFSGDSCCSMLSFGEGKDLSFLKDKMFRIRFTVENGEFYSFWLSSDTDGTSGGRTCGGLIPKNTAE